MAVPPKQNIGWCPCSSLRCAPIVEVVVVVAAAAAAAAIIVVVVAAAAVFRKASNSNLNIQEQTIPGKQQ